MGDAPPYVTLRSRRPTQQGDGSSLSSSGDSTYGSSAGDDKTPAATHDISRVDYHVKHLEDFAKQLEDSAARAFPNHGQSQRYQKVHALLLHWTSDDLFVLPELEDLEQCLREDYSFETETFAIPSDNPHLELMMKIAIMVKEHESTDTLFVVYYGGHARIDESRQSTWCANRSPESPSLQWSAIQTLLERSPSDVLILLDCCAGAASATFPTGSSITETISASSWDAIAPDPGRYSFTTALIEILQEWKNRTYSAVMLHAEVLARLKHPRPIMRNGRHFEARSTPVHFMMTSNHRAPSIEMTRILSSDQRPPSPPREEQPEVDDDFAPTGRRFLAPPEAVAPEPNEQQPHVLISLALEEDQRLDVNAWQNWLSAFPAIAKYVKVQALFKSHSNLLLLSLPVMVWDMLPESLACNFIAFIRSNNLATGDRAEPGPCEVTVPAPESEPEPVEADSRSIFSGTTWAETASYRGSIVGTERTHARPDILPNRYNRPLPALYSTGQYPPGQRRAAPLLGPMRATSNEATGATTRALSGGNLSTRPELADYPQSRLEEYFQGGFAPTQEVKEFFASNLGIEVADIDAWFSRRRQEQKQEQEVAQKEHEVTQRLQNLRINDHRHESASQVVRLILPGQLNSLLDVSPASRVLLVDLRRPVDYEKSHIHGAVNFRAPATFVQRATFEMMEQTVDGERGRRTFKHWRTSACVVFYDKQIEFAWDCPAAEALVQRFQAKGWSGQGFILKGHYREFEASFDKYIGGTKMGPNAKKYLESVKDRRHEQEKLHQQQYEEWLRLLDEEGQIPPTELVLAAKFGRMEAMVQHQKELENELEQRLPSLYRKALDLKPDMNNAELQAGHNLKPNKSNAEREAALAEPLSRGLAKMHGGGSTSQHGSGIASAIGKADDRDDLGYNKLGEKHPAAGDEYGDLTTTMDSDEDAGATFQKSSGTTTTTKGPAATAAADEAVAGAGGDVQRNNTKPPPQPPSHHQGRGMGNLVNRLLRSGGKQ